MRALCALGHRVTGMTRAGRGVDHLRELGAEASSADAFDSKAVRTAIQAASPDVLIDQLTSLPANPEQPGQGATWVHAAAAPVEA